MRKKNKQERDKKWKEMSSGLMGVTGMTEWMSQHPTATLEEIEEALDERILTLRAQMLEDAITQASKQEDWEGRAKEDRPKCEQCGTPVIARGKRTRILQTSGGQEVKIERRYVSCPDCGEGFFFLDSRLDLGSHDLTPKAQECITRLCSYMPFDDARKTLRDVTGAQVSKSTARRCTLETGEALLAAEEHEREYLQRELPEPPQGAKRQMMSADGAMVPLVGGEWGEVKTLVIADMSYDEQGDLHLEQASSVSRLSDAGTFATETLLEVHRKGLAKADEVCAVQDGAEWLQGLVDYHRSDALRILDFPHAAEYIADIGDLLQNAGVKLSKKWLSKQLRKLKHQGPHAVLPHLQPLLKRYPHIKGLESKISYLQKREMHMRYPEYQAAGWPIGSGVVESSNKLVVEARLKGAGMHWKPENVNKMLILRNALHSDRFLEKWKTSRQQLREERKLIRQQHHQERYHVACYKIMRTFAALQISYMNAMAPLFMEKPPKKEGAVMRPQNSSMINTHPPQTSQTSDRLKSSHSSSAPHRPAANHPWRKPFLKPFSHCSLPPPETCAKI
jgi:hypothetical protein